MTPDIVLISLLILPLLPAAARCGRQSLRYLEFGRKYQDIRLQLVLVQAGIEISGTVKNLDGAAIGRIAGAIDLKNNEAGLGVTLSSGESAENFYATIIESETMAGTVTTKDKAGNPIQTRWKAVRNPKTARRQF